MREATTAPPLLWSRAFPAIPVCTREARRFLAAILTGCPDADNAILCLSELVTNAIVHSRSRAPGGRFFVHVYRRENVLRVEVSDQGGPWAPLPTSAPPGADGGGGGGRGLLIVARLARCWGRTGGESGRTIWFEMECW
jgi:anti-sigma regulatory factor (Ser/Thr protein kinase)